MRAYQIGQTLKDIAAKHLGGTAIVVISGPLYIDFTIQKLVGRILKKPVDMAYDEYEVVDELGVVELIFNAPLRDAEYPDYEYEIGSINWDYHKK